MFCIGRFFDKLMLKEVYGVFEGGMGGEDRTLIFMVSLIGHCVLYFLRIKLFSSKARINIFKNIECTSLF